jgi:hypothetical protein
MLYYPLPDMRLMIIVQLMINYLFPLLHLGNPPSNRAYGTVTALVMTAAPDEA